MSDVVNIIFASLFLLCWFLIIKKIIADKLAPVKTVEAEVVDKYRTDIVSKVQGTFKRQRYIVVFKTKDKKLSFAVSEFSYNSYKIKTKGTLKYKGNRIVSFQ
ncbi:MAG: DUF2500 family protein [Clostridia bacterium]|nr:DUF2500 family protein [Clostridia bacterium]